MADFSHFQPSLFQFLDELTLNNNREWFQANKGRYEAEVREPARAFIRAMGARLEAAESFLTADDGKVGGSLMRVFRDTRFSKDKTPYKTNVGIQFRHAAGKDVHAPGFYLHLSPGEIFCGIGMWRPDKVPLQAIREAIAEAPEDYLAVVEDPDFAGAWRLGGEALTRAPKGFEKDHPAIEHIKRKDFIAVRDLQVEDVTAPGLLDRMMGWYDSGYDFCGFLCGAIGQPF
ncbi:MAG: DUF2461 domain-containing protein [Myxococcales bacterium]|nr:DUF2461 domain-containing protein [Myxococcales bacterium]MCB9523597.1 DUF2461 domain-containing protein [Myxococcales bacterium]